MSKRKRTHKESKFDCNWKNQGRKSRCLHILGRNLTDSQWQHIDQIFEVGAEASNFVSQYLHEKLTTGKMKLSALGGEGDPLGKDNFLQEILRTKFGLEKQRHRRSASVRASRYYKGYLARNKQLGKKDKDSIAGLPKSPPRCRNKFSYPLTDGLIKYKRDESDPSKGTLEISLAAGRVGNGKFPVINVSCVVPKGEQSKLGYLNLKETICGTLMKNKNVLIFVPRVEMPIRWPYNPLSLLSFDMNWKKSDRVKFNHKITINGKETDRLEPTSEITALCNELNALNVNIKPVKGLPKGERLRSCQRRKMQYQRKKLHRQLLAAWVPICRQVIEYAKAHKMLLLIDPLSCGAKTGSFGQDKFVPTLTKMCEDEGVPFVHVPTPYTSKACHHCGHECERDGDVLICRKHGVMNAHDNAAKNIEQFGWIIWQKGMSAFLEWRKVWYVPDPSLRGKKITKKKAI
jgi:hypothetical protein